MGKFEKQQKAGLPDWMGTYGDLVTLLLCFFIMLFATAEVDAGKFDILIQAFNPDVFDFTGGDNIIGEMDKEEANEMSDYFTEELAYQSQLKDLESALDEFVSDENLDDSLEIIRDNDKITLRFDSSLLFESGKAVLKNDVKPHLKKLSETLPKDYDIQIEGHTDNLKINNHEFSSNWELSAFRGINVLKYLIDSCGIDSDRLSVAGYGEFRPIATNDTAEGRSQNRRVDIILFKNDKSSDSME